MIIAGGSIVLGGNVCNANCPWCVSQMFESPQTSMIINEQVAMQFINLFYDHSAQLLITSVGDPLMYTGHIDWFMDRLCDLPASNIGLQTNGVDFACLHDDELREWNEKGLRYVSLNVADIDPKQSNKLMRIDEEEFDYWETVQRLRELGFVVDLSYLFLKTGVNDVKAVRTVMDLAKDSNIDVVTFRNIETEPGTLNFLAQTLNLLGSPVNADTCESARAYHIRVAHQIHTELTGKQDDSVEGFMVDASTGRVIISSGADRETLTVSDTPPPPGSPPCLVLLWTSGRIRYAWGKK